MNSALSFAIVLGASACGGGDLGAPPAAEGAGGNGGAAASSSNVSASSGAIATAVASSSMSSMSSVSSSASSGSGGGGGSVDPCAPIPGAAYSSLGTIGAPTMSPPAAQHPDINLKIRGWVETGGTLGFVMYGGATDPKAPRLDTIFSPDRIPAFVQNYQVNGWDWAKNMANGPIPNSPVTLIGFGTTIGEPIELAKSGYDIGQGFGARVLYADSDSITLKYTGEDNVIYGYTIHIVGVCVEPSLLALYQTDDAAGRSELPALDPNQPLGRARQATILVAIRDTGSFMDPRSEKDWWP